MQIGKQREPTIIVIVNNHYCNLNSAKQTAKKTSEAMNLDVSNDMWEQQVTLHRCTGDN